MKEQFSISILFEYVILGFALTEAIALFTTFLLLFIF